MFGRLAYTPAQYYRMGWVDLMAAIEGFNDGETAEMNKLRHLIAAPAWAMGCNVSVKQIMPLPIDKAATIERPMTKEEFLALDREYREAVKQKAK